MTTSIFLNQLTQLSKVTYDFSPLKNKSAFQSNLPPSFSPHLISAQLLEETEAISHKDLIKRVGEAVQAGEELLEQYECVKEMLVDTGSENAAKKSQNASQIERNNKRKGELNALIEAQTIELDSYVLKEKKLNDDRAWFDRKHKEIEDRKKSGNNYIPFYGIDYAIKTNKMVDDYNRKLRAWEILESDVSGQRPKYLENVQKKESFLAEVARLTSDNIRLEGENPHILNLLDIVNAMIVALQSFVLEANRIIDSLRYASPRAERELDLCVTNAFQEIESLQNNLKVKLDQNKEKLPSKVQETLKKII